jgi:hypothetical protein
VDVNGPAVRREVPLPDLLHEVSPAEHLRRVRAQEGQQLELLVGQRDLVAVRPHSPLLVVEEQPGQWPRLVPRIVRAVAGVAAVASSARQRGVADGVTDDRE